MLMLASFAALGQAPNQGDLLIADASITDPNFEKSVLLVLRNDENGTLALLINRPTALEAAETFPEITALEDYPGRLYYGGPVLPTRLLLLLRDPPTELADSPAVVDGVFLNGSPETITQLGTWAKDDSALRVYAGHAAWGPGQLQDEIAEGSWRVVDGRADLVFSKTPLELWERASTLGSELAVMAR